MLPDVAKNSKTDNNDICSICQNPAGQSTGRVSLEIKPIERYKLYEMYIHYIQGANRINVTRQGPYILQCKINFFSSHFPPDLFMPLARAWPEVFIVRKPAVRKHENTSKIGYFWRFLIFFGRSSHPIGQNSKIFCEDGQSAKPVLLGPQSRKSILDGSHPTYVSLIQYSLIFKEKSPTNIGIMPNLI